jgi:hypothetical protein
MDRIRAATTADDIGRVVRMVEALTRSVNGPQTCDPAYTGATVLRLINSPLGVVFITDGGFIAGEVIQTVICPEPVAVEVGWYAVDRSGLRLLGAFEAWAAKMNCSLVKMSSAADAGVAGKILRRRGYSPVELAWVK